MAIHTSCPMSKIEGQKIQKFMNGIPLPDKGIWISTSHSVIGTYGQVLRVHNTNGTQLTKMRPIQWGRSAPLNNTQYRPGWPRNLIPFLWRLTQRAHMRPLHFLCWASFLKPWGCEDHGYMRVSVCVCAVDTKEGDLIWLESRLVNVNGRINRAEVDHLLSLFC